MNYNYPVSDNQNMLLRAGVILIFVPFFSLFSQSICPDEFVEAEKNIKKIYNQLKRKNINCSFKSTAYLEFAKRAYLAEEYPFSLWSIKKGLQLHKGSSRPENAEFYYYLGLIYLSQDRLEEAISALKKNVYSTNIGKLDPEILQKSHLALVQTYYNREKTHDKNVKYLIELFKSRYKSSPYLFSLRSWNTQKYSN